VSDLSSLDKETLAHFNQSSTPQAPETGLCAHHPHLPRIPLCRRAHGDITVVPEERCVFFFPKPMIADEKDCKCPVFVQHSVVEIVDECLGSEWVARTCSEEAEG